jgi:methylglutaconyl-CoA hydratase
MDTMINLTKIETEVKDKQITIWLNQPEIRNALNPSLIGELIKVFKWAGAQENIMVIILRGRGSSFCSGADLKWMLDSGALDYQHCYSDSEILANCFHTIYQSDKVVINLVHGDVFGGAFGFLGAADFTFAVKETRFCLPELRLGLIPAVILPYLMTKVRPTDIKYQTYNTGIFTADEASDKGFIDFVCSGFNEMDIRSDELIQKINSASAPALTEAKRLFRELNRNIISQENIKSSVSTITRLKMSDDSKKRMSSFFSKK